VLLVYGLSNSSDCDDLECPWRSFPCYKPFQVQFFVTKIYSASHSPSACAELSVVLHFLFLLFYLKWYYIILFFVSVVYFYFSSFYKCFIFARGRFWVPMPIHRNSIRLEVRHHSRRQVSWAIFSHEILWRSDLTLRNYSDLTFHRLGLKIPTNHATKGFFNFGNLDEKQYQRYFQKTDGVVFASFDRHTGQSAKGCDLCRSLKIYKYVGVLYEHFLYFTHLYRCPSWTDLHQI